MAGVCTLSTKIWYAINPNQDEIHDYTNCDVENPFALINQIKNYTSSVDIARFFTCGVDGAMHQV